MTAPPRPPNLQHSHTAAPPHGVGWLQPAHSPLILSISLLLLQTSMHAAGNVIILSLLVGYVVSKYSKELFSQKLHFQEKEPYCLNGGPE